MRLVVLTFEMGRTMEVGRVVLIDGRAYPDHSIAQILPSLSLTTKPEEGEAYLREIEQRLHNAPYLWAEVQEDDDEAYEEWVPEPPNPAIAEDPNFLDRFVNDMELTIERSSETGDNK